MVAPLGSPQIGGSPDPRLDIDVDEFRTQHGNITRQIGPPESHGHNTVYLDNSITFENYHWWANRARENEKHIAANAGIVGVLRLFAGVYKRSQTLTSSDVADNQTIGVYQTKSDQRARSKNYEFTPIEPVNPATTVVNTSNSFNAPRYGISEEEWETSQRVARTASWGAVFYLITTDILGPFTVPWAFAQLGYGPSAALFLVFAVLAYYSAMQLWRLFIGLDSPRYPIRNYGDLGFRLFGNWARVTANFLQTFQCLLNVVLCIVANGQSLAQMAAGASGNGYLCFVVAQLIFTLIGFVLGQIRTLERLGWLANLSVWLNVTIVITTMVAVYIYAPNYAGNAVLGITGPIHTSAGLPPGKTLADNVNGVMNTIFSFGGATMFNEFMAEMRRPFDFWKAILISNIFITVTYFVFGFVVYSQQGQYTFNPTFQGYKLQTLGNALFFVTSVIAALLYGNIGMKILYAAVLRDVFKFPPLDTTKGKWTWSIFVPIYWSLAFILAAAVPQISNISAFEGALTIMQFSYTFPPLLMIAYNCQKDSALPEEQFDPRTGQTTRVDTGFKRWWRGFRKQLVLNTWDSIYFLAAVATSILGLWASVSSMIQAYRSTNIKSFGCANPAGD